MKGVTLLGSTGSIGKNTLDVISRHLDRFRIIALTAQHDHETLYTQCLQYQPIYAVLIDPQAAHQLETQLKAAGSETQVLIGSESLEYVVALSQVDYVMAAIVGAAGLKATLAAARAGKRILLANKEALVMAGELFINEVRQHHAVLLPVDSEHNAIFQCLSADFKPGFASANVRKIILTASGGPFRTTPLAELAKVTPDQACAHPNWKMGRKISTDSATMMNKGLEVIEAHWLFGLPAEKIEVVLHPQSTLHALVEYSDGSLLTHLGMPDMRIPIAYTLSWPERMTSGAQSLDLIALGRLDFAAMDLQRFPCLKLAYDALKTGGTASAILNAANEIAVASFLAEQIPFTDIYSVVAKTLDKLPARPAINLDTILEDDTRARAIAQQIIHKAILSAVA